MLAIGLLNIIFIMLRYVLSGGKKQGFRGFSWRDVKLYEKLFLYLLMECNLCPRGYLGAALLDLFIWFVYARLFIHPWMKPAWSCYLIFLIICMYACVCVCLCVSLLWCFKLQAPVETRREDVETFGNGVRSI